MCSLVGLDILAVVGARVVKAGPVQGGGVDAVMMFGFVAAFCTIVAASYQDKLRIHFPLLAICVAALSVYGFLDGNWTLGFSLAALSISEFVRLRSKTPGRYLKRMGESGPAKSLLAPESRVARMFGST